VPVKARSRACLVDTIRDPTVDRRAREHAAEELLRAFPTVTKTVDGLLGLFPRPVPVEVFDICADSYAKARGPRREFSVINHQEDE